VLTTGGIYTKQSNADYPNVDVTGPMYAINRVTVDNGVGGIRGTSYEYKGLKSSYERGSLGFAQMTSTDEVTGIITRTNYRQDYPFTGQVSSSTEQFNLYTSSESDDIVLSKVTNAYTKKKLHTGTETPSGHAGVQFVYAHNVNKQSYELNRGKGGAVVSTVVTTQTYDNYGNPLTIHVTSTADDENGVNQSYKTRTVNQYNNDTTKWHLGRLIRTNVTNTLPDDTYKTRMSAFEYDANTGLLKK
jgi:hypothetical protein